VTNQPTNKQNKTKQNKTKQNKTKQNKQNKSSGRTHSRPLFYLPVVWDICYYSGQSKTLLPELDKSFAFTSRWKVHSESQFRTATLILKGGDEFP
jgi:hypothetical protein